MDINETNQLSCQFDIITESNIKINQISNINNTLSIHYIVYRIDNIVNGKYYIGQHKTLNPLDNYMGSGKLITQALDKYDISCFIKTILFDFESFEKMDNCEKTLVPLLSCYPANPLSYNLVEGGNSSVNRFAGKTDKELKEIRLKIKQTRENWDDETKKKYSQKISNVVHQRYVNMSDEEYERLSKNMSDKMTNIHKNRSAKFQLEINQKISNTRKQFSDEKLQQINEKTKLTISNYSEERQQEIHLNRSNAAKQWQQNESTEHKYNRINKWKQSMNNKTDEEKQKIVQKYLDTMNNKSDDEKMAISKKRSQTLLNRSEEEKQAHINKIKKTRSEWSDKKRKSIYENQSRQILGRKRMNNGKHEISIKPKDIQKYLNLGYIFGRLKK